MKLFSFFISMIALFISSNAAAHTDHHLGEGSLHMAYHMVFWGLIIWAGFKVFQYFKNK